MASLLHSFDWEVRSGTTPETLAMNEWMGITSAETAAGLFKNHDLASSDRKVLVFTAHNYSQGSLALGRYGPNWHMLQRLCSTKNSSTGRVGGNQVAHYIFLMTFNLIGNPVLSRDLVNRRSKDGHEFYDAMNSVMTWAGTPNVAEFLTFLKWLDPQGIMRNMVQDMGQTMRIVEKFVKERTEEWKPGSKKTNDFLDALLEHQGDEKDGPDVISDQKRLIIILVSTMP
ncbi:PREDICTED: cytochrome P450 76A1 [Populus euphratica]|uniref:Cytochrome P450 76A1 n=1 Tax=Populus euphratica TaxID=75702 RepID=A0AAJ6TY69_POPEU|nr:PREDICTED: cytochrome P450 76A1 [Populus euphratica]